MASEKTPAAAHEDEWGAGWDAHRQRQLTFALDATPAQRLAWLEEAIAIAYCTGALPRPRVDAAVH